MTDNIKAGSIEALTWDDANKGDTTKSNHAPWVIIDIGFSGRGRTCGVTINGKKIPDPVQGYNVNPSKPRTLGDKHYGMLCPAIKEWLNNDEGSVEERAFNLMIEAPLSMAFASRSNSDASPRGVLQGNPIARIPDRLEATDANGRTQTQQRLWYTQPASGLMVASMRLIQELAAALEDWEIRLFEGFVSFKEGNEPKGHWRDTCKLWKALPITSDSNLPRSRPIVDPTDGKVESILGLMGCERDNETPPILRVTGPGAATVFAQPRTQRD